MATTVSSIVDNAESIAASTLSTGWNRLRFVWQPEKNDGRVANRAYGIRPGAAEPASGIIKNETLRQAFTLLLTDVTTRTEDDSEVQAILDTLYDKADQVFKQYATLLLNLGGTVIQVEERSIAEPLVTANGLVVLETTFFVKYRQTL